MQSHLQHDIPEINPKHPNLTPQRKEFIMMGKYVKGLGIDFGSGSNRLSPTILSIDRFGEPGVDMVWDVLTMGQLPFREESFDFVFTSHVLEDFQPEIVPHVFDELLRIIKIGGYLITIGPDMENSRYPKWDEKFTAESPEVIRGERQIGETLGNPSHLFDWGLNFCHKLKNESRYKTEIMQEDTIPHSSMSIDFVVKKL